MFFKINSLRETMFLSFLSFLKISAFAPLREKICEIIYD